MTWFCFCVCFYLVWTLTRLEVSTTHQSYIINTKKKLTLWGKVKKFLTFSLISWSMLINSAFISSKDRSCDAILTFFWGIINNQSILSSLFTNSNSVIYFLYMFICQPSKEISLFFNRSSVSIHIVIFFVWFACS